MARVTRELSASWMREAILVVDGAAPSRHFWSRWMDRALATHGHDDRPEFDSRPRIGIVLRHLVPLRQAQAADRIRLHLHEIVRVLVQADQEIAGLHLKWRWLG